MRVGRLRVDVKLREVGDQGWKIFVEGEAEVSPDLTRLEEVVGVVECWIVRKVERMKAPGCGRQTKGGWDQRVAVVAAAGDSSSPPKLPRTWVPQLGHDFTLFNE